MQFIKKMINKYDLFQFLCAKYFVNKKCRTTHMPPDLDLCPNDPKINRGHLLVITNLNVKYEDSVMNGI